MSMSMPMSMPGFYPMMPMPMPMPMPNYYYPIHQIPMDPNLVEEDSFEEGEEPEEPEYHYDSYDDNDNYCESCDTRLSHKGYAYCDMCDEKGDQKKRYMKKAMKKGKMELSELM